jgi:hypothetical protein
VRRISKPAIRKGGLRQTNESDPVPSIIIPSSRGGKLFCLAFDIYPAKNEAGSAPPNLPFHNPRRARDDGGASSRQSDR